jgi:hypothetical protein
VPGTIPICHGCRHCLQNREFFSDSSMLVPKGAQNQKFERFVFESRIAYLVSGGSLIECPNHILDRYRDLRARILQCLRPLAAIFNAHAIEHINGGWLINCNLSDCLGGGGHNETPLV